MIGSILNNRYKIVGELGNGSEGEVYLVEDRQENNEK